MERTQPGLPLGIEKIATQTHDYRRHGTLTLFAALNYLEGKIFRQTAPRHPHREWLKFLQHVDREAPEGLTLHLIVDHYATHKHAQVRSWVKGRNARHRKRHGVARIELHFTPTGSSWMNLVERFFRDLTVDCIRAGSFGSVRELVAAIEAYLAERDLRPVRYRWHAHGEAILRKLNPARLALGQEPLRIDNCRTSH